MVWACIPVLIEVILSVLSIFFKLITEKSSLIEKVYLPTFKRKRSPLMVLHQPLFFPCLLCQMFSLLCFFRKRFYVDICCLSSAWLDFSLAALFIFCLHISPSMFLCYLSSIFCILHAIFHGFFFYICSILCSVVSSFILLPFVQFYSCYFAYDLA